MHFTLAVLAFVLSNPVSAQDTIKESHETTKLHQQCIKTLQNSKYDHKKRQYFLQTADTYMLLRDAYGNSQIGVFSLNEKEGSGLQTVALPKLEKKEGFSFAFKEHMKPDEKITVSYTCQWTSMTATSGGSVDQEKFPKYSTTASPLYKNDKDQNKTNEAQSLLKRFVVDFITENQEAIGSDVRSNCKGLFGTEVDTLLMSDLKSHKSDVRRSSSNQ